MCFRLIVDEQEDSRSTPETASSHVSNTKLKKKVGEQQQSSHPGAVPLASLSILSVGGAVIRPSVPLCGS